MSKVNFKLEEGESKLNFKLNINKNESEPNLYMGLKTNKSASEPTTIAELNSPCEEAEFPGLAGIAPNFKTSECTVCRHTKMVFCFGHKITKKDDNKEK